MLVFTKNDLTRINQEATSIFGIPAITLMEHASKNAFDILQQSDLISTEGNIVVVCGGGDNGGDGYALARHLSQQEYGVKILAIHPTKSQDAATNEAIAEQMGIQISPWTPSALEGVTLIIDAIFGTGLSRDVEGIAFDAIEAMNAHPSDVISLDIPSGMECDTGHSRGTCIHAAHTITFVGMKVGFLGEDAKQFLGIVEIATIGCPESLIEKYGTPASEYDG